MNTESRRHSVSELRAALAALGRLFAGYARTRWPHKTAEHVATVLGVSVRHGERLIAGRPPTTQNMLAMIRSDRMRFVRAVIHPIATGQHIVDDLLARRRANIEAQIERQRNALAEEEAAGRRGVAGVGRTLAGASRATLRGIAARLHIGRAA